MKTLILTIFLAINSYAQSVNLKTAIEKAQKESEQLKIAQNMKTEALANQKEAQNYSLGQINLKAAYTKGDEPVYSFAQTLRQGKFSMAKMASVNNPPSIENTELSLEGGIPIFSGFKISNYRTMADMGINIAEKNKERTQTAIKFNTAYLYLTAILKNKLNLILDEIISNSQTELDMAEKLNKSGMIPGSDYYAALAIQSGLKDYKSKLEAQYKSDLRNLYKEIGGEANLEGDLKNPIKENLDCEKLASLSENSSEIEILKNMSDINSLELKNEKNSLLPQAEAFGVFYGNSSSINSMRTSSIYGIRMSIGLWDPLRTAKKEKAQARFDSSFEQLKSAKKELDKNLKNSCENYKAAVISSEISLLTAQKAAKSLELFKPLYRQGKQSIMEVLRAQKALFEARAFYYESVYKTHLFYLETFFIADFIDDELIAKTEKNLN